METPRQPTIATNTSPVRGGPQNRYPSDAMHSLAERAVKNFEQITVSLDLMNRTKSTEEEFKSMNDLVQTFINRLKGYEILKTWGGKKTKKRRQLKKKATN